MSITCFPLPEVLDAMTFPKRIKALTELAGRADPRREIYGSKKTDYKYNPVIDIEKICEAERRYGFEFPREYVRFLTEIGNGGAGVDHGMYPFERVVRQLERRGGAKPDAEIDEFKPTIFDSEDPDRAYYEKAALMAALDEKYRDDAAEQADALYRDIIRGMVVIGTAGSSYDYFIMVSGRKKGRIGIIDRKMRAELGGGPQLYDLTLSEWLEDHFKRIILGEVIDRNIFYSVKYTSDLGWKMRAVPREYPNNKTPDFPALHDLKPDHPAPVPAPAPQVPPRTGPAISPAPQPQPGTVPPPPPPPPPRPVPPPPPPKKVYRVGDFIKHVRYGSGMITNVVNNIISAEFTGYGLRSIILPYDEKDIIK